MFCAQKAIKTRSRSIPTFNVNKPLSLNFFISKYLSLVENKLFFKIYHYTWLIKKSKLVRDTKSHEIANKWQKRGDPKKWNKQEKRHELYTCSRIAILITFNY